MARTSCFYLTAVALPALKLTHFPMNTVASQSCKARVNLTSFMFTATFQSCKTSSENVLGPATRLIKEAMGNSLDDDNYGKPF